jgi:signal transduction histidine kinase
MTIRPGSYGYSIAIILLVLVLGLAGRITWLELGQLHRSFGSIQPEAFQISDQIAASIKGLNDLMQRFDQFGRVEDRTTFQARNAELILWVHAHRPMVTTSQERELIGRIETALTAYSSISARLMDEHAIGDSTVSLQLVSGKYRVSTGSLIALNEELRVAEHNAEAQFLEDSRHALVWLEELLVLNIGLFIVMVGTSIVAIYRGVIGPLRVRLSESQASAARNEKLASLGTLAAGVAHEIRNPLTAINVRLHSLKKHLIPNTSEQEDALVIGHEIQRLDNIVHEFLLFARPADPKFHTVSADSLLGRMQSLFGKQLEKNSIRLVLESPTNVWVRVDPHQLEQVLINLVQNAAESMAYGGTITVRASYGSSRLDSHMCPVVLLEVSDTGTGIPPEARKRIFDPFFTTKENGTGLGLAIAARIIEKHGGSLECHSEVNRGSTFTILLPKSKTEQSDEPPDKDPID